MKPLYTAKATAFGDGRTGTARSSDGTLDLTLTIPRELGGTGDPGTNPEQLFAAGYAACFHSALRLVARQEKTQTPGSDVTAQVGIGARDDGGFGLAVELLVSLPGVEPTTAERLVTAAHDVCPYSHATRGNIEVRVNIA
jgi:osmotically inducible protein OsmC